MGSVKKRPDGTWRARWREYPGGPERAKHFRLKEDALRHVNQMENDVARGVYVDPRAGQVSLVQVMTEFVAAQPWRTTRWSTPATRSSTSAPTSGTARSARSAPPRCRRSSPRSRPSGLEPRTVQTMFSYVRKAFRAASTTGSSAATRRSRVKLPQHDGAPVTVPTLAEVVELHDAAPDHFAVAIVLAAGLGLRASEAAGLTVDRVDSSAGRSRWIASGTASSTGSSRRSRSHRTARSRPATVLDAVVCTSSRTAPASTVCSCTPTAGR